jgi:hypothetical protein
MEHDLTCTSDLLYSTLMELKDLKALEMVVTALGELKEEEQGRVLRWAAEKLGLTGTVAPKKLGGAASEVEDDGLSAFNSVADALGKTHLNTDSDRALVAAAFLSKRTGRAELTGLEINKHLKDAGHRIGNITQAINFLKKCKPQLMVQTKKDGTSKQARKNYKVTAAGFAAAEKLLQGHLDEE